MAEDKQDTPQQDEIAVAELKAQRLSERLARVEPPAAPADADPPAAAPGRRSHLVGQPGRMVLGSRMANPNLAADELGATLKRQQLFSSERGANRRRLSSRATVLLICAFVAGTAAGLTWFFNGTEKAGRSSQAAENLALQGNGAPEPGPDGAAAPVGSVTPATIEQARGEPATDPVQLAQSKPATLAAGDITAEAGAPALLDISVEHDNSGDYTFLMFRGLPQDFSLSAGFPLKGSWAVSLSDLVDLTLIPPAGYSGRFELEIMLVMGRETPVESQRISVAFNKARKSAPIVADAAPVPHILTAAPPSREEELRPENSPLRAPSLASPAPPPAAAKPALAPEKELPMLERAFTLLGDGDVVSARMILEHLAKKGSGKGALALAQTYDPLYFQAMNTLGGPRPDAETALKWYGVAVRLGQEEARGRLSTLSGE